MDLIHEMISPNGERKVRVYKRTDGFFEYEEVLKRSIRSPGPTGRPDINPGCSAQKAPRWRRLLQRGLGFGAAPDDRLQTCLAPVMSIWKS